MKRSSPSLHILAAATTAISASSSATFAAMSSRPPFRAGRARGRGPGHGRRSYSDHASSDDGNNFQQFVSGDSHYGQVRDANRSFRPQNNRGSFRNFPPSPSYNRVPPPHSYNRVPPPPSYNSVPPLPSYNRVTPPQSYNIVPPPPSYNLYPPLQQPFDQNQQLYRPPRFNLNQQFRPPAQHQQQLRPRPPKDLEYRNWQYANPGPPTDCERFTILSYNILADYLVRDHWDKLYFHIPRHLLDWQRRKRSILFELGLWSADIMCLQEVDRFEDLKEELELRGYSGTWKMRTGEPVDGCAIFWRNSRFKLVYEESIEFCKLGLRDNVAQICVFESLEQGTNNDTSALSSSAHARKLVVCNTHVLFNPKRGEIKLGQVRVLLTRAHAVLKLWDDAPLILCGDFNSTPKSPLYNFIVEQKLDLSELPRDKVSGQAAAEIHLSRSTNSKYWAQRTEKSAEAPPDSCNGAQINGNAPSDIKKSGGPDKNFRIQPSTDSLSPSDCSVLMSNESSIGTENSNGNSDIRIEQCNLHGMDGCSDEIRSNINISDKVLEESANLLNDDTAASVTLLQDMVDDLTLHESCHEDSQSSERVSDGNCSKFPSAAESPCNSISTPGDKGTSSLGISTQTNFAHQSCNSHEVSIESAGDLLSSSASDEKSCTSSLYGSAVHGVSYESTSSDFDLDGKMKSLSVKTELDVIKEDESVGEEESTFLSELHGSPFPSHTYQCEELDASAKEHTGLDSQELHSLGTENSDNTPAVDWETYAVEISKYDPSAWSPFEIETATGSPDCVVMEHALKLQSVYGEVEDSSGRRDSTGEPAVTSYHRRFMGTVDYMWRSEGLQTARVLAPIPKHAMLWTKGFPTKKWGSDHIALVSELAFTKDGSRVQ